MSKRHEYVELFINFDTRYSVPISKLATTPSFPTHVHVMAYIEDLT